MNIHFGAAIKLIQSKAGHPRPFGPVSEDAAVTRRFDDYVNRKYDLDETLVLTPAPNQRVVVMGEDFEPLQEALYESRQKIRAEGLNPFKLISGEVEPPEDRIERAEREIAQRYLQKAEADGKIIDLDA